SLHNQAVMKLKARAMIVAKHIIEKEPDVNKTSLIDRPVGTGPFKFKERTKGSNVTLERNPDYFLGRPHLDQVILKILPDENTLRAQVQRGGVRIWVRMGARQVAAVTA